MSTTSNSDLLQGTSVIAFESRMADATVNLLQKYGATAVSAPSMQEVPLDNHSKVFEFADHLFNEQQRAVDVMIYNTGVGTKMLIKTLKTRYDEGEIVEALSKITTVSRGPKPKRVLKKHSLPVDISVPEPNTWKEILEILDRSEGTSDLNGKLVAVQEYGEPNEKLNDGLRERNAELLRVPIYRWALPDDTAPLKKGIHAVLQGEIDIAVFTSKTQTRHVMKMAEREDVADRFREALNEIMIASIGPVCSSGLENLGIDVDFEPSRSKLGIFIRELAEHASTTLSPA